MKPSNQQVNELIRALSHLGATYTKIVKEGNRDTVVHVPYKFGAKSQAVRSAAARNLRLLRPHAEAFADTRNALLLEMSDGRGHIADEEKALSAQFNLAETKLLRSPVETDLDLAEITEVDLDLANNPIPPDVVATLAALERPPAAAAHDA
jgi:hypothetical protein